MNWLWFFGGMTVAVLGLGVGILLWHFDKLKVQSWGWLIAGILCAIVALYLGFQLFTVGGFLAWCWKLPCTIFAAMAAVQFLDGGIHGDQPPR